eukprot:TRINITY_DN3268_c0_g1_i2.p1 TRINITY_DN3268_c0_g1~~TRINITY_DN3268_c0_g1_i2.p1  ORF type:complete len:812 (-),score=258.71 TRINITY_DN3268_c0_g1_i2:114-2228(-)
MPHEQEEEVEEAEAEAEATVQEYEVKVDQPGQQIAEEEEGTQENTEAGAANDTADADANAPAEATTQCEDAPNTKCVEAPNPSEVQAQANAAEKAAASEEPTEEIKMPKAHHHSHRKDRAEKHKHKRRHDDKKEGESSESSEATLRGGEEKAVTGSDTAGESEKGTTTDCSESTAFSVGSTREESMLKELSTEDDGAVEEHVQDSTDKPERASEESNEGGERAVSQTSVPFWDQIDEDRKPGKKGVKDERKEKREREAKEKKEREEKEKEKRREEKEKKKGEREDKRKKKEDEREKRKKETKKDASKDFTVSSPLSVSPAKSTVLGTPTKKEKKGDGIEISDPIVVTKAPTSESQAAAEEVGERENASDISAASTASTAATAKDADDGVVRDNIQRKTSSKMLTSFLQHRASPEDLQRLNILHAPVTTSGKVVTDQRSLQASITRDNLDKKLRTRPNRKALVDTGIVKEDDSRTVKSMLLRTLRFKKTTDAPAKQKSKVFGVSLEDLCATQPNFIHDGIPTFLLECEGLILQNIEDEGIFRIAGSKTQLLKHQEQVDLTGVFPTTEATVFDASSLLSSFFRALPAPLLTPTPEVFEELLQFDGDANETELTGLFLKLPASHQAVLRWLLQLLYAVTQHSGLNKMGPENLSVVFTPSLCRMPQTSTELTEMASAQVSIVFGAQPLVANMIRLTPKLFPPAVTPTS